MRDHDDSFDFSNLDNGASDSDDGTSESIWLDLGYPVDTDVQGANSTDWDFLAERAEGTTADDGDGDNSVLPVLMVIADQQDFYH